MHTMIWTLCLLSEYHFPAHVPESAFQVELSLGYHVILRVVEKTKDGNPSQLCNSCNIYQEIRDRNPGYKAVCLSVKRWDRILRFVKYSLNNPDVGQVKWCYSSWTFCWPSKGWAGGLNFQRCDKRRQQHEFELSQSRTCMAKIFSYLLWFLEMKSLKCQQRQNIL